MKKVERRKGVFCVCMKEGGEKKSCVDLASAMSYSSYLFEMFRRFDTSQVSMDLSL